MAMIEIATSNFQPPYAVLNGNRNVNVSRLKCMKYAIAVGTANYSFAFAYSLTALALAVYRAMAVACVLDFSQNDLRLYPEYGELESSEKTNLSYWIGMTFTAIAAREVLGIPRTVHASRMNVAGRPVRLVRANPASRSLADLVGEDASNAWHVLEAKGRQGAVTPGNRADWKAQAGTVASIDGAAIATGSYSIGFLANPCRVELVDPPSTPGRGIDLPMKPHDFREGYYGPYHEFLATGATTVTKGGRGFSVKVAGFDPVERKYVFLGLDEKYASPISAFAFEVNEINDVDFYCSTDGVAVGLTADPCKIV